MKIAFPDDFSDRLSPMLVKELRQGLRARAFIGIFLTLQIVIGIILIVASTTASSEQVGNTISGIIFIFFSIAVIIIQPLRGMGALSSEIKGNTIDMMVLTRLSAWRIVAGKWSAIVSQSALIFVTIIPYLILRYFFGGMNLFGEVIMLLIIFLTSATLTAITVGLSASTSVILRSIFPIVGILSGIAMFLSGIAYTFLSGSSSSSSGSIFDNFTLETTESKVILSLYVTACFYYGYFLLSIGTTLIAPHADNHSTIRRIIALIVTLATAVIGINYADRIEIMIAAYIMIFVPIFTISLTEFSIIVPPVLQKFNRFGVTGKLLGIFFLPGWATGVFFCYLLTLIAIVSCYFIPHTYLNDDTIVVGLGLLSSIIFPAILVNLFKIKGPARVSNYILMCVASSVISSIIFGISESLSNKGILWLFIWIPQIPMIMKENHNIDDETVILISNIFNIIYFIIFCKLAISNYRESIRALKHNNAG